MTTGNISTHFEKARSELKNEHDSMVQRIKEEVSSSKQRVLSRV